MSTVISHLNIDRIVLFTLVWVKDDIVSQSETLRSSLLIVSSRISGSCRHKANWCHQQRDRMKISLNSYEYH